MPISSIKWFFAITVEVMVVIKSNEHLSSQQFTLSCFVTYIVNVFFLPVSVSIICLEKTCTYNSGLKFYVYCLYVNIIIGNAAKEIDNVQDGPYVGFNAPFFLIKYVIVLKYQHFKSDLSVFPPHSFIKAVSNNKTADRSVV